MWRFSKRLSLFMLLNGLLAVIFVVVTQSRYTYTNASTEAHLHTTPKNQHFDAVFLGSSHGRVLSSTSNHARVENILSMKIFNYSKTSAGIMPEKMYFSYFLERGNTTDQVVYFIDPFIFYSDRWNEHNYFLEDEPITLDFLRLALKGGVSNSQLFNYIRSKFTPFWINGYQPSLTATQDNVVSLTDDQAVEKRLAILYPKGVESAEFARYRTYLRGITEMATTHHIKLIFVFTPTLLGTVPGMAETQAELMMLQKEFPFSMFDFFDVIVDKNFFADRDHLNTAGVEFFTRNYLKKILSKT